MKIARGGDIPFVPASHESVQDPSVVKRVLLTRGDVSPGHIQMVNWAKLLPGRAFTSHYHEDMDEVFVIVRGRAQMTVGPETTEVREGDAVVVPAGMAHRMEASAEEVEYIVFGSSRGENGKTVTLE